MNNEKIDPRISVYFFDPLAFKTPEITQHLIGVAHRFINEHKTNKLIVCTGKHKKADFEKVCAEFLKHDAKMMTLELYAPHSIKDAEKYAKKAILPENDSDATSDFQFLYQWKDAPSKILLLHTKSDFIASCVAVAVKAPRITIWKDQDGIYPHTVEQLNEGMPIPYGQIRISTAKKLRGKLHFLSTKLLTIADTYNLPLRIRSYKPEYIRSTGTDIKKQF